MKGKRKMNKLSIRRGKKDDYINYIIANATQLFQNGKYEEARICFLDGCNEGDYYCMVMFVHLTVVCIEAEISVSSSNVMKHGLYDLAQAEKWAIIAQNSGQLEDENILTTLQTSLQSIYSLMVWCNYLSAIEFEQEQYYKEIINKYHLINHPRSRESYAYMNALRFYGDEQQEYLVCLELYNNHDSTLTGYMLGIICLYLSYAYFDGRIVKADYEYAYKYAQEAYLVDPEGAQGMLSYFQSGEAEIDFYSNHPNV